MTLSNEAALYCAASTTQRSLTVKGPFIYHKLQKRIPIVLLINDLRTSRLALGILDHGPGFADNHLPTHHEALEERPHEYSATIGGERNFVYQWLICVHMTSH